MTQRQLANVLLKISGITGLIHALPMFLLSILSHAMSPKEIDTYSAKWINWLMPLSSLSTLIICAALILFSEKIAAKFFRPE